MQNAFFKRMAALVASVTVLALVIQPLAAFAYSESDAWNDFASNFNSQQGATQNPAPGSTQPTYVDITNITASKASFDPAAGATTISFNLSGSASTLNVSVKNFSNGAVQTVLANETSPATGYRSFNWSGNGIYGTYTVEARATDIYGQTKVATTYLRTFPTAADPSLAGISVTSSTVNLGQTTTVSFTTKATALLRVNVRPFSAAITSTPVRSAEFTGNAGSHVWTWNGYDDNNQPLPAGNYKIYVSAFNTSEPTGETEVIQVTLSGSAAPAPTPTPVCGTYGAAPCPSTSTIILNPTVSPSAYNPLKGLLQVNYFILGQAYVTVTIFQGDYTVKQIKLNTLESNANTATWDGRYMANGLQNGAYVPNGTYKYRIVANYGNQTDAQEGFFTVNSGTFSGENFCAGFKDVSINSMYCNAIAEMQKQGVFVGYADGTFRPGAAINRAETVKVVMLALKYNVPLTGWYFNAAGFKDVYSGAWYTPYLAAARLYKVINGYPDNTFKPAQTVNRAELSKIFLEASNIAQTSVPCDEQPYKDKTKATWFGKYACLVKYFSLVEPIDGKFAGATAMTRGDVALMIYRAQAQNLLKTLPPKAPINFNLIQQNQFPYKVF